MVATEVKYNRCRSDVLAMIGGKLHEVEVKVSLSDLRKDFEKELVVGYRRSRRKMNKHALYTDRGEATVFVPHFFCFAVPLSLVEEALVLCAAHPKYGVWCWEPGHPDRYKVVKAAKPLNADPLNKSVVEKIIKRTSSELVQVRMRLYTPGSEVPGDDEEEED